MNSYNGICVGDPVQHVSQPNVIGKVDRITPIRTSDQVFIAVKLAGWKFAARVYAPDELKLCRCVNRGPMMTPLAKAAEEKYESIKRSQDA